MSLLRSSASPSPPSYLIIDDDAAELVQVSKKQRVDAVHTTHNDDDDESQDEKTATTITQTTTSSSTVVITPSPLKGRKRMTKSDSIERYRALSDDLVKKKWKETILPTITKKTYGNHECWESSVATQGIGYCQLQLNGRNYGTQQGFYLLHIWSMRYHERIPADLSYVGDPDCSHLCHNKRCVNPDHLVFEEGRNNKRRNVCPHIIDGILICPFIHDGPACRHPHCDFEVGGVRRFAGY
jgi:hypothetical protein